MLTEKDIQQFYDQGYLTLEAFFQGHKLRRFLALLDELTRKGESMSQPDGHFSLELDENGEHLTGMLHKVQGVCVVEPKMLKIAGDDELLNAAESLVGPNIDVFGTKFFPKLPRCGTSTKWHQDNYYFATNSDRIVSCGIYFHAADRENGCLRVIPRSHVDQIIAQHNSIPNRKGKQVQVDESQAVDVVCPAGTVVFFSANLLHGADDNTSARCRYSTAWHYLPEDLDLERFPRGDYEDRFTVRGG